MIVAVVAILCRICRLARTPPKGNFSLFSYKATSVARAQGDNGDKRHGQHPSPFFNPPAIPPAQARRLT